MTKKGRDVAQRPALRVNSTMAIRTVSPQRAGALPQSAANISSPPNPRQAEGPAAPVKSTPFRPSQVARTAVIASPSPSDLPVGSMTDRVDAERQRNKRLSKANGCCTGKALDPGRSYDWASFLKGGEATIGERKIYLKSIDPVALSGGLSPEKVKDLKESLDKLQSSSTSLREPDGSYSPNLDAKTIYVLTLAQSEVLKVPSTGMLDAPTVAALDARKATAQTVSSGAPAAALEAGQHYGSHDYYKTFFKSAKSSTGVNGTPEIRLDFKAGVDVSRLRANIKYALFSAANGHMYKQVVFVADKPL